MAAPRKGFVLSPKEIEALAEALVPKLISQVQAQHHEFWIDPKSHYDEHHGLREMLQEYRLAKGVFWKVFILALAAGATAVSGIGVLKGWFKFGG